MQNRLQPDIGEVANAGTAIDADPVLRRISGAIAIVPQTAICESWMHPGAFIAQAITTPLGAKTKTLPT